MLCEYKYKDGRWCGSVAAYLTQGGQWVCESHLAWLSLPKQERTRRLRERFSTIHATEKIHGHSTLISDGHSGFIGKPRCTIDTGELTKRRVAVVREEANKHG